MSAVIHLGIDPARYPAGAVDRVKAAAPDYEVVTTTDRTRIESLVDRVEIALARFPHDLIPHAPRLRWLQQEGAGADWLESHPHIAGTDLILTNASGVHAVPISEQMLGYLLALGRSFPAAARAQNDGHWIRRDYGDFFELEGKSVMILGTGAIGARFARLCEACDMTVIGVRRDPSISVPGVSRMIGPQQMLEELPNVDVIANTLPYTRETRHILGRREFQAMRDGAIVINIGRGGTIDEEAMIDALRSGKLRAAGLDVFETEPLPSDSPLWAMENVLLTPHFAGLTPRYNERLFEIFIDNLERYVAGQPLRNVVDKTIGY